MRLVHVRARNDEDVDCLMRELSVYSPKRSRRAVLIEVEGESQTALLALLSAVETCLSANDIPSVRVEIEGKSYMMAPAARR
jgi:hypothetical protein